MPSGNDAGPAAANRDIPHHQLLQILLDNLPAKIFVIDRAGRILLASRSMEALFGAAPGGLEGRLRDELLSPEESAQRRCSEQQAIASGRPVYTFDTLNRPGEPERVFLAVRVPWTDDNGEVRGIAGISTEISQVVATEKRLRDSESAHRVLFEKNPQPMWVYSLDTLRFLAVNEAAIRHYGYSREEFLSMTLGQIRPAEDMDRLRADLAATVDDLNYAGEWRHVTRDGRILDVEIRSHRLDWDGAPARLVVAFDITARKQAQRELERSEAMFRFLTESMQDVVWTMDPDTGRYLYVSPSAERIGGYSPADFTGLLRGATYAPGHREAVLERMARQLEDFRAGAITEHDYFTDEVLQIRKDGSPVWTEVVTHFRRDPSTGRVLLHGLTRDITARRQASEELDRFFNLSQDLLCITDRQGALLRLNPQWATTLGYPLHELTGRNLAEFIHPGDPRPSTTLPADGELPSATSRFRCRDGSYRTLEWHSHAQGGLVYSVARDITDKQRHEERLRDLSRAIEQSPAVVVITDVDGRIEYVNPRFEQITGYSAGEVLGKNPRILQSGLTHRDVYSQLWETILRGEVWEGILENKRKDGTRYTERISISPVRDDQDTIRHFVAVKENITEQLNLQAQLVQAQKMEAIGLLAGGIAHDFNNLLTIINGYSELALASPSLPGALRHSLETILQAGQQAAGMTRQLLLLGRKQPGAPILLELNPLVTDLGDFYRRVLPGNILLDIQPSPQPAFVVADPTLLEQVVMNLVLNARDAMPNGGRLTIRIGQALATPPSGEPASAAKSGPYVLLEIDDTGVGMSDEVRRHLFEPFFSTKPPGKGTGLGLATVFGIVEQSNGWIDVRSSPGAGSTFRIYLPSAAGELPAAPLPAQREASERGHETILLIEDAEDVRRFASEALASLGYTVLSAASGEEGIAIARQTTAPIHLVLTDVMLPGLNGIDAVGIIRRLIPSAAILYTSGYVGGDAGLGPLSEPGVHFLSKPFTVGSLAAAVRQAISTHTPSVRILVVDDEPAARELLAAMLAEDGYQVSTAGDGNEALACLENTAFDLMLLDLVMPEREGLETLIALRQSGHDTRVIAISGAFGGQFLEAARLLGARSTLLKPISRAQLLEAVAAALQS